MAKKKSPEPASPGPEPAAAANYTVLARRYRPQQFADLVGQEAVARALTNALESGRVAHAYLFTGSRGVGKTSTARILARALNCAKGPTSTPCGTCDACQAIAAGEDVDVLEIDGASNRGIDEVREIRQNVQFRPSRSLYKIYIIDEVHMLTAPAFNALLKTLEEPPAHVKFIFATTEVQKIPVTILSRCQRFDFAGIGTARIVARLREIVAGEKMQADDEALELVARRAAGSMRDSQSLLDQLLAFGGERLTAAQVHQLLGTANEDRVIALAAAVLGHDAAKTLDLVGQAADEGLQLSELLDQVMDYWRDLMVVQCAGVEGQNLSVSQRYREGLARQAAGLKLDTILAGLDILAAAKARMRGSSHGRILLEMALVRLGRLEDLVSLSQLAQWVNQPGAAPRPGPGGPASTLPRNQPLTAPPEEGKKKDSPEPELLAPAAPRALTQESLAQLWPEIRAQAGTFLASDLEKANSVNLAGPTTLVLSFPAASSLEKAHCQEPANMARLEMALKKVTGQGWNVRIESAAAGSGESETGGPGPVRADPGPSRSQRVRQEAQKVPLVLKAMEALGAQILDMEEGFGVLSTAASEPEEEDVALEG